MKEEYLKEWITFIHHKRFAISTYQTYTSSVEWFLKRAGDNPKELTYHEIRTILLEVKEKNSCNRIITAIRQFYLHIFNRELDYRQLPYTKKQYKVQPIYTHEEALKILQATKSPKQKAVLALIIDCGFRSSEPCSILLSDCRMDERKMILRSTKHGKDHVVYPSQYVWDLIDVYLSVWNKTPQKYVFEGQVSGNPYTNSSIRQFVERSCKKCGVEYKAVNSFRRYMITWSIENDVDITAVADKVNHNSIRTIQKHYLNHSEKYLKSINSPLNQVYA